MVTLESEFERAKAQHKHYIVKFMAMNYFYGLLHSGELEIPKHFTVYKYIALLAEKHIKDLVVQGDNLEHFNKLYEKAYDALAPRLQELDERRLYV